MNGNANRQTASAYKLQNDSDMLHEDLACRRCEGEVIAAQASASTWIYKLRSLNCMVSLTEQYVFIDCQTFHRLYNNN